MTVLGGPAPWSYGAVGLGVSLGVLTLAYPPFGIGLAALFGPIAIVRWAARGEWSSVGLRAGQPRDLARSAPCER